jgi:predicted DsbA family dithiol-disulfide isomerase
LKQAGAEVGFPFNFGKIMPNTLRGHCLSEYVLEKYGPEKQHALMMELFKAYFSEGKNVSTDEVLVSCLEKAGLSVDDLKAADADDGLRFRIVQTDMDNKRKRISGVPAFIFNGKYMLSGAQPEEVFEEVFEQIADMVE